MASFCCSIEMEPRTLNEGQITLAREVAEDIVQKKEHNEASGIFIEGLRPVVTVKEMTEMAQNQKGDSMLDIIGCKEKAAAAGISETSCQCLRASDIVESPDQAEVLKEPLSAPF
ncbi:uncharacterized protein LOC132285916 [Cornus florida]|uniref:uncharacterized protein LOC132285916 n=1 Tax=Cornus florida TaxID=4283 RepID=UPI00289C5909|nr:uncharacterized protein LOC132285916 [Cornus florida]